MRGCSEDMTSGKGLCSGLCAVASLMLSLLICKGSGLDQISS